MKKTTHKTTALIIFLSFISGTLQQPAFAKTNVLNSYPEIKFISLPTNFNQSLGEAALDPSFGTQGVRIEDIGTNEGGRAVISQPDGKIIVSVCGLFDSGTDCGLIRYDSNGTLDDSFGTGGLITSNSIENFHIYDIALQSDGKIITAGNYGIATNANIGVIRYNYDGSLDSDFGENGVASFDLGAFEFGNSILIDINEKIIVAGYKQDINGNNHFLLVRYNNDGSLDTSFGSGGHAISDFEDEGMEYGIDVLQQPDGRILVAGSIITHSPDYTSDMTLVRYNNDGSLDTTFGEYGLVTTDISGGIEFGGNIVLQPDNKIVFAGATGEGGNSDFMLVRYQSDGTLDPTFGTNGIVVTDIDNRENYALFIALRPDGKIVAGGMTGEENSTSDFALAQYLADGSLDVNFGNNGIVITDLGKHETLEGMTIQPSGKIVASGNIRDENGSDILLVRYIGYSNFIVTKNADTNDGVCDTDCSLREAIAASYNGATITFTPSLAGQTIYLTSTLLIEKGITVDGSSLSTPIHISGDTDNNEAGDVTVFHIGGPSPVELRNLVITKGKSTGTAGGGGIANYGTLTIKNSTISNNEYVNGLGGGGIYNKGSLTVIDSVISRNTAIEGGGIFNELNSELTISGTTFSNNSSITEPESPGGSAGAIGNIGTLTIENSTFTNNLAYSGGGAIVNAINGTTNISNSVFTGNTTYGNDGKGGAIINMDATMIVETSTFNSNTSKVGGAIYNDGQLTISGGTFTENDASSGNGGGIANLETLTLADASLSNNSASLGGGIYNSGLEITITNTTINSNSAGTGGGGIANEWAGAGLMVITNSTISGNTAPNGGGMHNLAATGTVSISDTTISNNTSTDNGGGITSFGALSLSNTLLLNNSAFEQGGAVFILGTTTISDSTLMNNSSEKGGGGIYNDSTGVLILTNSTMSENSAGESGGAIKNAGELIINGTLFFHNQAEDKGGAIYTITSGSGSTITNSTITQNISVRGGAIGADGAADNTIRNTTFVHNQAIYGSEIWTFSTAGQVQILNSILLCENFDDCLYYRPGGLSLSPNTLIQSGNLASVGLSPLADNGGPTQTMALLPGSPAINAGTNATCTEIDQRGIERPQGDNCDLGAYEYIDNTAPSVSSIIRIAASPTTAASVDFTVTFSEDVQNVGNDDFSLTTPNITGAAIMGVTPVSASVYTVSVNTGTGNGSIRLNLIDDDSIEDLAGNKLGGSGAGNGTFISGDTYIISKLPPKPVNAPIPSQPRRNSISNNSTPTFVWNDAPNAIEYEIVIATDSSFSQVVLTENVSFSSFTPPDPLADGKYFWRVRAYNAAAQPGRFSVAQIFSIDTTPPAAPVLTSPSDTATLRSSPVFRWNRAAGAVSYEFQYDNDADVSSPTYSVTTPNTNRKPPAMPNGTFFWRVRAQDAAGNWSDWSIIRSVTISR